MEKNGAGVNILQKLLEDVGLEFLNPNNGLVLIKLLKCRRTDVIIPKLS